jgi:acetyl esterase/lipase
MTGVRFLAVLLFLPLAAASAAPPDSPAAARERLSVRVEKGIPFATVGGEALRLDLARPTTGGPYPGLLLLHGGAWRVGSRADLSTPGTDAAGRPTPSLIEAIAAHGYVVASASYRFAPKYPFPAQLEDARAALRFLRANAKTYHLDPAKVAAGGFSAGGHLALLLGLADPAAGNDAAEPADPAGRVQCVVSFFGPTDQHLYAATPGHEDAYMVPLLGKACKTDPTVYERASPITYVSKDDPPVLMVHGTADVVVPIIHSERLLKKLHDAGVTAELVTVPGAGHPLAAPGPAWVSRATPATVRFLDEHLKGKK